MSLADQVNQSLSKSEVKKDNKRTLTCSQEIRDRIKEVAARQRVQMRDLVESWLLKALEEAEKN